MLQASTGNDCFMGAFRDLRSPLLDPIIIQGVKLSIKTRCFVANRLPPRAGHFQLLQGIFYNIMYFLDKCIPYIVALTAKRRMAVLEVNVRNLFCQVNQKGESIRVERLLLEMQHKFNPLHVYCRLIERGIDKHISIRISRFYEILIYKWLAALSVVSIYFCRLIKSS